MITFQSLLLSMSLLLLLASPCRLAQAYVCQSGAEVDSEARCRLFIFFRDVVVYVYSRISARLNAKTSDDVRSIALVVGVSKYEHLGELAPAGVDFDHLVTFFRDDQRFDEVIALRDGDVTKDNLEYFLDS